MKQRFAFLFQEWHAGRWIRLGLGILIGIWAFVERDGLLGLLSGLFLLQSFTNSGCCGTGSCGNDGCSL